MELRGFKRTEAGVVPKGWVWSTVRGSASRARNAMVGGPFGSDLVSKDYVDDGVPVIRGQNMGKKTVSGSFVFVNQEKARSLEANMARPGDVVFTQRGTLGQVSLVPDRPFERYLVSQSQMKVSLNRAAVDPEFFYYLFTGPPQQEAIRLNTIQTGVPHINLGILAALPVALPELAEQRRIAKALSDADALIESLEQLLAKKRHLKQGAMQELLTGNKRLPGFAVKPGLTLTEAGAIPVDWGVSTIGVEFSVQLGKMLDAEKNVGVSRPFLGNRAVQWGKIDLADIGEVRLTPSDMQRFRLRRGDLLVCEGGEVGRAAIWREPIEECYYQKALHRLRPSRGYNVDLMLHLLHRLAATGFLTNFVTQTSIAHLPKDKFETVPIPLPSGAEQEAIAGVLSDMEREIVALEAKLIKARQIKQGMMQELLTGRIRLG